MFFKTFSIIKFDFILEYRAIEISRIQYSLIKFQWELPSHIISDMSV